MSEEKMRIHTRITQEMERKINAAMPKANCQSRNEFLEEALQFYCNYLTSEDVADFLPPIFIHAMRGTLQCSEDRIARLLFKLTVELSMMMNVLAAGLEIDASQLDALRWRCVQEVKKTNGTITFKDTLAKNRDAE
ncbi:MAG: hypothetical protein K2K53_05385 [Oscillospiraceae bacterium]|nr:hypothetical protein [Oscillospiraceae bacterium]